MSTQRANRRLLIAAFVGMELSWRYACLSFLGLLLLPRPFPWAHGVLAFLGSALLTALLSGRGLRIITGLLLHLVCLGVLSWHLLHFFHGAESALFSWAWFHRLSQSAPPLAVWATLIFELILITWMWVGGFNLARRPKNYHRLGLRFDLGLTALFGVILLGLLLSSERFGVVLQDQTTVPMVVAFFCFGLLGLALARVGDPVPREISPGYRGVGLVLTFLVIVLALSGGALSFFLPYLSAAAETGYQAFKYVAKPLVPYLVAILRFLLVGQRHDAPAKGGGQSPDINPGGGAVQSSPSWLATAGMAAAWVMLALLAVLGLLLLVYLAYRVFLRLLAKTDKAPLRIKLLDQFFAWVGHWAARAAGWAARAFSLRTDPLAVYAGLLRWGRKSGLPRQRGETPREYGRRLAARLPRAALDIQRIIDCLEQLVFAQRALAREDSKKLRQSWRRLARPGLWAHRLRAWFPGRKGQPD